jgi:hypothetical protein
MAVPANPDNTLMRLLGLLGFIVAIASVTITPAVASGTVGAAETCAAFESEGLEADPCRKMRKDDWGISGVPDGLIEARRFIVKSLCDRWEDPCDSGGRVMRFRSMRALREQKSYYDGLGDQGDLFFSWTFVNRRHLLLVQINGELGPEKARRYRRVVSAL